MTRIISKSKSRYQNGGDKEKVAEYYIENKESLKENAKNKYRNFSEEQKEAKGE